MKAACRLTVLGAVTIAICLGQPARSEAGPGGANPKVERMPESLEIRFALSASPPQARDAATVYVLDPAKGYVLARQGSNGVSCIVVRSDWQWGDQPFHNDIFWPVCYDAEGSRTLLQDYLYAAELRARGMDAKQVNHEVTKRFGTAAAPNPSRVGVAYMIAPIMRGFIHSGVATMNMPHYMFYAPKVTDKDIGGNGFGQYPFMLSMGPGRDDVIIMLVGEAEKAKILKEHKDLLAQLCEYRDYLCTTDATRKRKPTE